MNPYIVLPKVSVMRGRRSLIIEKCRGKRVLHVGCVDTGVIYDRFNKNELMHQNLVDVANELWGVDINEDGIEFLRQQGFMNLVVADAVDLHNVETWQNTLFDVIVTSEVVEHLQNPGLFFQSVKQLMKPGHTELIISVPNAFRIDTLLWLMKNIEFVHPDHNYWFSYLTITNLVHKNGLVVKELFTYTFQPRLLDWKHPMESAEGRNSFSNSPSETTSPLAINRRITIKRLVRYLKTLPKRLLVSYLYRKSPFWGDGLIVVAGRDNHV